MQVVFNVLGEATDLVCFSSDQTPPFRKPVSYHHPRGMKLIGTKVAF